MGAIRKRSKIISIINEYLYDSLLPLNINYFYAFGSIAGICLTIQLITGIFLAMHYVPNIDLAFDSVEHIMREVPYGWLIRTTHSNGAFFFFFVIYLHMARGIYYGSYIGERYKTWIIGVIIFLIMIITAFIGYSLVYGQMSLWGMTVITNLLTSIPFIGTDLVQYIWGGFSVGGATLNRFYSLHYLLPFVLVGLVIVHLIYLHTIGSSNPLGFSSNKAYIPFHPYYTLKDLYGFLVFFIFLFYIVFFHPYSLGHTDNFIKGNPLVTPNLIVPESYLLPFYAILRSIPNKTLGVVAMIFSILSLLLLPILHFHTINSSLFRPLYKTLVYTMFLNFFLLAWIGQKVVESPFIFLGQIFTFFYFFSLLFLLPLISFFEFFLSYFSFYKKY